MPITSGRARTKMVSKLDLAVIAAAAAGAILWVEHGHHVLVETPTLRELAMHEAAAACPDHDDKPYTVNCLTFLQGPTATAARWRSNALEAMAAPIDPVPPAAPTSCPESDNVPYSAGCLAFL